MPAVGHGDRAGLEAYVDEVSAPVFFCQFPETSPSDVPKFLDTEMVRVFEDTAV